MVSELACRTLRLLVLTFQCCSLASDTDFICSRTAFFDEIAASGARLAAATGAALCPQITQLDEITGAFFVQRHAMRYVAGVSVHSNESHPSDLANMTGKRRVYSMPADLLQHDVVHEDILTASVLSSTFRQVSSAGVLDRRRHKVHLALETRSTGEKLCLAAVVACALVALYFYAIGLNPQAPETTSNDVAHKPSTPLETAPVVERVFENRSPRDVVEDLGFGMAQLRILFLANGVWFLDGWELALVNTVATSTALDMGLNVYGRAMLSSLAMLGLIPGCMLGGWLGDKLGRKPPIIASYFAVAVVSWGTSLAPDAQSLFALRGCMGIACGLGMPSSTVMMSELAPARRRGTMVAGRGVLYTTGIVTAQIVCLTLDPTLEQLNWRLCFMMVLPPTLLFLIPTCIFLYESPLFFACIGDHQNAKLAFEHMRKLNSCPEVSISYTDSSESALAVPGRTPTGSFWDHLRVIFSVAMLACSVTLMCSSATASLFGSGHAYGLPRVLIEESEKHYLTPAAQIVIDSAWAYLACLLLFGIDFFFTRKKMLIFFYAMFTVAFSVFAWSATSNQHSWFAAVALQTALAFMRITLKLILLTVHLASTECYPTELLSTGTAMVLGLGRIGSAVAPFVFEWLHVTTGSVVAFYYASSVIAFGNCLAIFRLLPEDLETARQLASRQLEAVLSSKIVGKAKACAG